MPQVLLRKAQEYLDLAIQKEKEKKFDSAKDYYFMAKMEEESFGKAVEHIINSLFGKIGRGCFKIVIDTSGIV